MILTEVFSRNLNTGDAVATGTRMVAAGQMAVYAVTYPSRIICR